MPNWDDGRDVGVSFERVVRLAETLNTLGLRLASRDRLVLCGYGDGGRGVLRRAAGARRDGP